MDEEIRTEMMKDLPLYLKNGFKKEEERDVLEGNEIKFSLDE